MRDNSMPNVISVHPLVDKAGPHEVSPGDPFAEARVIAFSAEARIAAGSCGLASGTSGSTRYPHHELIIVRGGKLILDDGIRVVTMIEGSVAVIPQGISVAWSADAAAKWDFMSFAGEADPAGTETGIVVFDLDAAIICQPIGGIADFG
jgi:uncharacterized cupin superfamily protein